MCSCIECIGEQPEPTAAELAALTILETTAFRPAPRMNQWGDGMLVADIALSRDETMTVYIHKNALKLLPSTDNG